ncbi:MAG: hypothetical protein NTU97_02670 [Candidatus Magasanikbacteria bacterium]|nr:hypothetical protein [Candidatus Magasanikbacteria bacterium]
MAKLNILQNREVTEVLKKFGLNDKEKEVYLGLIQAGATTLTPLSKMLRLPITTIQSILSRLHTDGLVGVSKNRGRHVYEAHDPAVLKKIREEEIREITNILPFLKKLQGEETPSAKVQIFYRERMTDIFLKALESKNKVVYEIVSGRDIQDVLGEKFHFTRRRLEIGIHLKSLRVEKSEIKKYSKETHVREMREARFLPKEMFFKSNLMFWDNQVAIFSAKNEGLAILIESPSIKEMVSQIFELLWSVSRRMESI